MSQINLLPWRDEIRERANLIFYIIVGIAVACCLVVNAIVYMQFQGKVTSEKSGTDYIKREISSLDRKIKAIKDVEEQKNKLMARMDIIQVLQSNRSRIVRLFDSIARAIPDGLYLTSLEKKENLITMEGKTESNSIISIFMRNLENLAWFDQAKLGEIKGVSKAKEQGEEIGFSLEVTFLEQDKPLNATPKTTTSPKPGSPVAPRKL